MMIGMNEFIFALIAGNVILILLMLIRVFRGPTIFDRLNGVSVIGINVIILLVFIGFISGREAMYLDIAITFAILGFVGSMVIARFLYEEGKRGK